MTQAVLLLPLLELVMLVLLLRVVHLECLGGHSNVLVLNVLICITVAAEFLVECALHLA